MANRYLYQFKGAFEAGVVDIYAKVAIGASGAPTLVANQCKGIASIVHNSAGNYTINLMDPYVRTLLVSSTHLSAAAPAAPSMYLVVDNVTAANGQNIIVQFNASGTPTDPSSGDQILIKISLKNSSI